ncbi:MAG: hypothetical protein ABFS05_09640 [Bacteroidota bacterium]
MNKLYVTILTLALLLIGQGLFAQEQDFYVQDTLLLKSGEAIPCKISTIDYANKQITVQLMDTSGVAVFESLAFDRVNAYIIGSETQYIANKGTQYKIDLQDGTRLTGNLISENDSTVIVELKDLGELKIQREKINRMIPLSADIEVQKAYWFKNPNATRLLFAPTAIPLRKGEGYYQNIYIVGNMFNVGVADNFSIGGGFDFITMFTRPDDSWQPFLNFNAKAGVKVHKNIHVAAGGIYATMINEFSAGIPYALGTFGNYNSNFTTGLGWGFVDGDFEEKPFIMLGGMARCSEKIWLVSENWIAPMDEDNNYYLVISYGVRFSGKKISVDLAFLNSKDIFEQIIIGIPYVDFVIKFGE